MIRPTGNTAPPKNFTSPGFDALIPAEPPDTTSESRPPNESITPAATCSTERLLVLCGASTYRCLARATNRFEEHEIATCAMFCHTTLDHRDRYLGGLERAWGIEAGHCVQSGSRV